MPTSPRNLSDADLGSRLAKRDADALAELYDRYGALAYSVALRVLGDSARSEDVVQEAFLKIWNAAATFDSRRGSLRGWLLTAVRNCAVDHLRGRAAHERDELELDGATAPDRQAPDPWGQLADSLEREAIRAGLLSLPTEQRQVVELAYFGGYSGREIADMVRCPLGTVKGRMRLALEKLQSYFQGKGLEPRG
jgi:RNA polymerase sigma-70 factor, ECF subfamily